ncbi:MAG: hypothetical protein Q4C65_08910 [Eubacteriales bacterium]|nr:hypothetical protein [Eubacteriales bacterium]
MGNLIAFINSFLSYLLVFAVSIAVIAAAVFAGIQLRRRKDARDAEQSGAGKENAQAEGNV